MMIHAFRLFIATCLFALCGSGDTLWAAAWPDKWPVMPTKPGADFTILRKTADNEDIIISWQDACQSDEGITKNGTLYILTKQTGQPSLGWIPSLDNSFATAVLNCARVRNAKELQEKRDTGARLLEKAEKQFGFGPVKEQPLPSEGVILDSENDEVLTEPRAGAIRINQDGSLFVFGGFETNRIKFSIPTDLKIPLWFAESETCDKAEAKRINRLRALAALQAHRK